MVSSISNYEKQNGHQEYNKFQVYQTMKNKMAADIISSRVPLDIPLDSGVAE